MIKGTGRSLDIVSSIDGDLFGFKLERSTALLVSGYSGDQS